jgi:hypothetical protein
MFRIAIRKIGRREFRTLADACGLHARSIIKASKAARSVVSRHVKTGVEKKATDAPHYWEWGAGVPLLDLAIQLGDNAFFWPPFWERLRSTIEDARTPDSPMFGTTFTDQREASDYAASQLKQLFELYSKRGQRLVGRPTRINRKALRQEYLALPARRRPKWRLEKAAELGVTPSTLRGYLSPRVAER